MKFFVVFSAAMALLSPSFTIASNSGDYDADEVYAKHRPSSSGGLQAPCDPHSRARRNGCQSGYYCEAIDGDPNQKGQCIPSPGAGLQDKCNPDDGGRSTCKAGYYCEPIGGDPNQKGQCIPRSVAEHTNVDYFESNSGDYDAGQVYTRGDGVEVDASFLEVDVPPPPHDQDCGGPEPNCGDGSIAMCCASTRGPGPGSKATKGPGPSRKAYTCVGSSGGVRAQCPALKVENSAQGCGGYMPTCAAGQTPMCCPYSRGEAKMLRTGKAAKVPDPKPTPSAASEHYICVDSSGGMRAQCPSILEVDTE